MPRNLSTQEALQMAIGSLGEQTLTMLDVVDLNGDMRRLKVSDEVKNFMFLDRLTTIINKRAEQTFKHYYTRLGELMAKRCNGGVPLKHIRLYLGYSATFTEKNNKEEFVCYSNTTPAFMMAKFNAEGVFWKAPTVTFEALLDLLKEIEDALLTK